jgi:hypothetical protein
MGGILQGWFTENGTGEPSAARADNMSDYEGHETAGAVRADLEQHFMSMLQEHDRLRARLLGTSGEEPPQV